MGGGWEVDADGSGTMGDSRQPATHEPLPRSSRPAHAADIRNVALCDKASVAAAQHAFFRRRRSVPPLRQSCASLLYDCSIRLIGKSINEYRQQWRPSATQCGPWPGWAAGCVGQSPRSQLGYASPRALSGHGTTGAAAGRTLGHAAVQHRCGASAAAGSWPGLVGLSPQSVFGHAA